MRQRRKLVGSLPRVRRKVVRSLLGVHRKFAENSPKDCREIAGSSPKESSVLPRSLHVQLEVELEHDEGNPLLASHLSFLLQHLEYKLNQ
ncbi:hypothetical protein B296_00002102 [Ensete ventricosum]|uniref:Uncharacterized protein n=1 Tax=Ensete ventricosum TaxID=4639 RepID=A0A427B954_ENSVE|nr:hypothetical protein B296_00002102 [Ensete ventricosum]